MNPARVLAAGRDISLGLLPLANSSTALLVAFILANSWDVSSPKSSTPPTKQNLALPVTIVSYPSSSDSIAVAQAPTGVRLGPQDEIRSMFTHAPIVFIKDS